MDDECRVQKKFTLNQAGRQKPSADTDPTPWDGISPPGCEMG